MRVSGAAPGGRWDDLAPHVWKQNRGGSGRSLPAGRGGVLFGQCLLSTSPVPQHALLLIGGQGESRDASPGGLVCTRPLTRLDVPLYMKPAMFDGSVCYRAARLSLFFCFSLCFFFWPVAASLHLPFFVCVSFSVFGLLCSRGVLFELFFFFFFFFGLFVCLFAFV